MRIKYLVFLLLIGSGIWYFVIKDYNYKITFTTAQVPGIVYDHILKWNNAQDGNNGVITVIGQTPFTEIHQKLVQLD